MAEHRTKQTLRRRIRWVEGEEYKQAIEARRRLAELVPKLSVILQDHDFKAVLRDGKFRSVPNISGLGGNSFWPIIKSASSAGFGRDVLAFTVVQSFIIVALRNAQVKKFLEDRCPGFLQELDGADAALRRHGFFLN